MEQKPGYYSILTADVRYHEKLSPFDKLLYSDITALTNKKGYCNASNKYFSKVFNKSISTISRSISTLSENNLIESILIRDENNEIVERKIYLKQTVRIPMGENEHTPIAKNDDTPIRKNDKDNNTSNINTTSKNIKSNNINIITKKEFIDLSIIGISDCDNVRIDQKEYDKLVIEYPEAVVKQKIIALDGYLEDHPKKYKSHYKALRTWLSKDTKDKTKNNSQDKLKSIFDELTGESK